MGEFPEEKLREAVRMITNEMVTAMPSAFSRLIELREKHFQLRLSFEQLTYWKLRSTFKTGIELIVGFFVSKHVYILSSTLKFYCKTMKSYGVSRSSLLLEMKRRALIDSKFSLHRFNSALDDYLLLNKVDKKPLTWSVKCGFSAEKLRQVIHGLLFLNGLDINKLERMRFNEKVNDKIKEPKKIGRQAILPGEMLATIAAKNLDIIVREAPVPKNVCLKQLSTIEAAIDHSRKIHNSKIETGTLYYKEAFQIRAIWRDQLKVTSGFNPENFMMNSHRFVKLVDRLLNEKLTAVKSAKIESPCKLN